MVLSTSTPTLHIDRSQSIAQLTALGYHDGDVVYLRGFFPDGDERKHTDKGRKLEGTFPNLPWSHLEQLQAEGRGIYFVVNGGGHKDDDVAEGRIFFFEHDDLEKHLSRDLWQHLGLPEPTIQVDTGGKSIHSYWVLSQPCSVAEWRSLQTDLLEFSQGDRKLKNPSRVMRLAGAHHIKPGRNPVPSQIISHSKQTYSFEQLRAIVPVSQQPEAQTIRWHDFEANFRLPLSESVPLTECLTRSDRDLIERGCGQGERNGNGFKLAANLIATADYLNGIGQRYDGEPQQMFEQFCDRCSPPLAVGEQSQIWKSASQRASGTSLSPDQIEACIKGWAWRQLKAGSLQVLSTPTQPVPQPESSKVTPLRNLMPLEQVTQNMRELMGQSLTPSQLQAQKIVLRSQSAISEREFNLLWDSIAHEYELDESQSERSDELASLVSLSDRRLRLSHYLHPHLAHPLEQVAQWMGVDAESLFTLLIPTAASLLNPQSRVIVKSCIDFSEPFVFYTGIVTPSGNKKSPMMKVVTSPLRKFQAEEDERYDIDKTTYEAELKTSNPLDPPHKPRLPREYFVDNITGEALDQIKAQQPEHGLLLRKDELSGLFGAFNAYRGGKGSDREGMLSGWNGNGIKVNRKGGTRLSLPHDATSIAGAIQPGKLRQMMGEFEDEQGDWARFLWYQAPVKPHRLPADDTHYSVGELLETLYLKLDKLPAQQYRFSPDAQQLYDEWHYQLDLRRSTEARQGMAAAIAKMQGYAARLAGLLHILWSLMAGDESVDVIIPVEQVRAAIELAEFYLGQVTLIHAAGAADSGGLTEIMQQILQKATQWGEATPRKLQAAIRSLRTQSANQVKQLLGQLQSLGYGLMQGMGKRIRFIPNRSADTADETLTQVLTQPNEVEWVMLTGSQPSAQSTADTADRLPSPHMGNGNGAMLETASMSIAGGLNGSTLMNHSVSTVSTCVETQAEQVIDTADTMSAIASAPSADLQVGDAVVLVGDANERCKGRELTAIWTVRRIDDLHVVVMTDGLGMRRFPISWVKSYPKR